MGGRWRIAALLLALACAAGLTACGGGSSTTGTTATTEATGSEAVAPPAEGGNKGKRAHRRSGSESNSGGSESPSSENGGSEEGQVSPNDRSAQFRTKGGDNSIQNFGEEEGSAERAKATKLLTGLFAALKTKEYAKACAVLSQKAVEQLEQFSEHSPQLKGKSCGAVLGLVFSSSPGQGGRPEAIKGGVIALRRKGGEAFALYHGVDGKPYAYPLVVENGQWKVIGMAPTPLNP
jgi:hypothetical protein